MRGATGVHGFSYLTALVVVLAGVLLLILVLEKGSEGVGRDLLVVVFAVEVGFWWDLSVWRGVEYIVVVVAVVSFGIVKEEQWDGCIKLCWRMTGQLMCIYGI